MQTAAFRAMGLKAVYVPLACDRSHLVPVMGALSGAQGGGNVTIPYKSDAADALDHQSELVRILGACNTFWGTEAGLWGDNTDVAGIRQALNELDAPATVWLIVGTGGSARAAVEAAREAGAAVAIKSRSVVKAARFRDWIIERGVTPSVPEEAEVVINATPLGMHDSDPMPVERGEVPAVRVALDLVYRRARTPWIRALRDDGLDAEDGRTMLVAQGAVSFEHWFPGVVAPREVMRAVVDRALR
jgi:shikimate dehydrogenase